MRNEVEPSNQEETDAQNEFLNVIVPFLKTVMKDPIKAYVKVPLLHICVHSHNEEELHNLSKMLTSTGIRKDNKEGFKVHTGTISKFCVISSFERMRKLIELAGE
jgi:hypothetical protein